MKEMIDLFEEVLNAEQIEVLTKMGFFEKPASTKYHLSEQGGLAKHSYNVTKWALDLNEKMNLGIKRADVIIAAGLHDICKLAMRYEANMLKSGTQSDKIPYKAHPVMDLGHGSMSIYLILNELGLKLSVPVATAITWHMGFTWEKDTLSIKTIQNQPYDMMLVLLIQFADQWSTMVTEHKFDGD